MDNECNTSDLEHTSFAAELARVVRYSTAALGGYLVAEGYASQATVEMVTGIIVTATPIVVGMILARMQRRHVSQVISAVKQSKGDSKPEGE